MKIVNDGSNNGSNNNWMGFSLSPHMKMEVPTDPQHCHHHYHQYSQASPVVANVVPTSFYLPSYLNGPRICYGIGETESFHAPLSVMPLKSDGSLCIMEALSRSQSEGIVPTSSPKLEDFLGGATMDTHQYGNHERETMALSLDNSVYYHQMGDDIGTGRGKHGEERAREPNYAIGKFEVSGGPGQQIRGASMESQGFKHEKIGRNRQERGASMDSNAKREQSAGASMESMGKRESDKETSHSMETVGELRNIDKEEGGEKREQLSLKEISKLRGTAQQNSMEALRAAEERYNKAKESAAQVLNTAAEYAKDKGQQARETARQSAQYAAEKGGQATNTVRRAVQQAAEMGGQTKDTIVKGAKKTSQYIAAKDITVEKTKEAAGLAGKVVVVVDVKDKAVVAGWTATHYITEKAVEGTKVAARMVEGGWWKEPNGFCVKKPLCLLSWH